jgi:hypothetical protein
MIEEMVNSDFEQAQQNALLAKHGFKVRHTKAT